MHTVYSNLNCHTITMAAGMTGMFINSHRDHQSGVVICSRLFLDSLKADHPLQVKADCTVTLKSLQTPYYNTGNQ